MNSLLVFLSFLTIISLTTTKAQERAPHGLVYENPMAFSPSAYNFFHPKTNPPSIHGSCDESSCAPLPMAAMVQSSLAEESRPRNDKSEDRVGAGAIAGVMFGFIFVVLLAMGVFYVVTNRRGCSKGESTILPSV
ncbi:uncharacterized protein LOC143598573 [Bidens hawaiensis]|uniref:uncharacterized protein LOC143598573 n=1 Tax=Bidens hawaiensis TaxID=980011 RepID=UPI00404A7967